MSWREITAITPTSTYYNLKDKLIQHVLTRSVTYFDRADEERNRIQTKDKFLAYQKRAKTVFSSFVGEIPYDKSLPYGTN